MNFLAGVLLLLSAHIYTIDASACDKISFITREQWNALPSNLTDMKLPVHHVFIHHTAEEECFDRKECTRLMLIMQQFHNVTRGFGDIGYNFLIGGDNNVYVGRDWYKNGRHTKGMNEKSVAFSLLGNYVSHLPGEGMMKAAKDLIECGIEKKVIAEDYQLHGHRDQVCTECPGDLFYNEIQTWSHYVKGPLKTYVCPYP